MSLSKRNSLSIQNKLDIIKVAQKEKLSARAIAVKFKIGKTQAAEIIKNKQKIIEQSLECENLNTKKKFKSHYGDDIDRKCLQWFAQIRSKNLPVSGPLIKAKALEIAKENNLNNFQASDGWLDRWRRRHNIKFKSICGESAEVNYEDVQEFAKQLPFILSAYNPNDIYNADESGVFFRALPEKTMAFKNEKCSGGKMAKDRLTILFCCNMIGIKEKLVVIGKAAKPRAFKNIKLSDLLIVWKSNKKVWMPNDFMSEWLIQFDRKMGMQERKILLFLDNAASHPKYLDLKNIKLVFLPPNTTCACQPLDQGIIQNFKTYYRNFLMSHILTEIDFVNSASDLAKKINVLDAIYLINEAWTSVSRETIKNCFKKAGFNANGNSGFDENICLPTLIEGVTDEYVAIDGNLAVEGEETNLEQQIDDLNDEEEEYEEDYENAEEYADTEEGEIKNYSEAIKVLQKLKRFAQNNYEEYELLKSVETFYEKKEQNSEQD